MNRRWLQALILVWVGTLLVWAALGADGILRAVAQDRTAARISAHLHLTAPAYLPAGHPMRTPEGRHPGIDDRHTPRLPLSLKWTPAHLLPEALPVWETQP